MHDSERQLERDRREVERYLLHEFCAPDAEVERAERLATEWIYGRRYDIWDVQTTDREDSDGRWWVVTNVTNAYPHSRYPSMNEAFSLHIGVTSRMFARERMQAPVDEVERRPLASTWRRYEQAAEAWNSAQEAEDFQAVGMRCRECLLTFASEAGDPSMVGDGEEPPKTGDVIRWCELIADAWASGETNRRLRSYLKKTSAEAWKLVNGVTHDKNAYRHDAEIAIDATGSLLAILSTARFAAEEGEPEVCPHCGSYRVGDEFDADTNSSRRVCGRCDWEGELRSHV